MATHTVFLPGESHGQRSLAATVHGVAESDTTEKPTHLDCAMRLAGLGVTKKDGWSVEPKSVLPLLMEMHPSSFSPAGVRHLRDTAQLSPVPGSLTGTHRPPVRLLRLLVPASLEITTPHTRAQAHVHR